MATIFAIAACPVAARSQSIERPQWFDQPYSYVVVDQPVRDALADLGRNLKIPVVVGDEVKARIRGQVSAGTAGDFLKQLCLSAQLAWYFDGNVLHVDGQSELKTEVIDVSEIGPGSVGTMLPHLGAMGQGVAAELDGSTLRVSGPPTFIALVHQNLDILHPAPSPAEVRIFRGGVLEVVKDLPDADRGGRRPTRAHGSIVAVSSLSQ